MNTQQRWPRQAQRNFDREEGSVRRGRRISRPGMALAALLALAAGAAGSGEDGASGPSGSSASESMPVGLVGRPVDGGPELPAALRRFAFVENLGQWDTAAALVASLGETVVQAQEGGFVVDARPAGSEEALRLRFSLEGARDGVTPVGDGPLPGVHNYLLGNDPERWRSGARSFAQAVYRGAYEGVDLRLREAGGQLEYDLHLAPGADLDAVVLRVDGAEGLEVDEEGGLLMRSARGTLRQSPPVTWCVLPSGEEEPVECAFVVLDERRFGFRLAEHDPELPVVIDPGLEWATFLGGPAEDWITGLARKANGDIVVTGVTVGSTFPHSNTVGNPTPGHNAFVSILDSTGATLLRSTLFGGNDQDGALDVEVDAAGNVFVVGWTASNDFPITPDAYQATHGGDIDVFVLELDQDLSTPPEYSSFLGGTDGDLGVSFHLRAPRVVTICGGTRSVDFPITAGTAVQTSHAGGNSDFFLCRLDLDQSPPADQLLYGTYLGGTKTEATMSTSNVFALQSVALHEDASGVVTLAGRTTSGDIPRVNAYQDAQDGAWDVYVARIDPAVSGFPGLNYASYVGGKSGKGEAAKAVAVDSAGVITLGGYTYSPLFPTTSGAFEEAFVGPAEYNDAFLLRLDPSQIGDAQLLYGTFLGDEGFDVVDDLVLDSDDRIIAQGLTGRLDIPFNGFPTTCGAYQTGFAADIDGFLLYLDPSGNGVSDLLYSTFVGGSGWDRLAGGLAIVSESPALAVVSAGATDSLDFPTTGGAYQETLAGNLDGVVLQLELNPHTYCHAEGNSANADGAIICGSGSVVVADNDLTLSATGLPTNKFGYFLMSATKTFVPNMGGGNGNLCLGAPQYRFAKDVLNSGTTGQVSFQPDLTDLPGNIIVSPGETWYFQLWYRDVDPVQTSNTSNGLALTFH